MNRSMVAAVSALLLLAQPGAGYAATDVLPQEPALRALVCAAAVQVAGMDQATGRPSFLGATRADQFEGLRLVAVGALDPDHRAQDWDAKTRAENKRRAFAAFDKHTSTEVVAACDAAYPQTLESYPVSLPADPDDRLLVCDWLAFYMLTQGYPEQDKGIRYPETERFIELKQRLGPMFTKYAEARGLKPGPAMTRVIFTSLAKAFNLGRPDKVLDACSVAYPAPPAT